MGHIIDCKALTTVIPIVSFVLLSFGCGPEKHNSVKTIVLEGRAFRDLNKNGTLDAYENQRLAVDERIDDLLSKMSLNEKAGLMFPVILDIGKNGEIIDEVRLGNHIKAADAILKRKINHIFIYSPGPPQVIARWSNNIQRLAEQTRLGIPVTVCTDPRHAIQRPYHINNYHTQGFTQWPDPIGLAATCDTALASQFASIAAREYRAVGIHYACHPMADLATEPRWGRIAGTFGEDAHLAARLIGAYIHGFQGDVLGPRSVACMTKHFPGGGPQKDGWDVHYQYGKEQVYPGNNLNYHLVPFQAAIKAGTAAIMPYYGIPVDQTSENVGMGFNKEIITGILRKQMHFDGVVCADYITISPDECNGKIVGDAKCWGVEALTIEERFLKAIEAGVDQFGGEKNPDIVIQLIEKGRVSEERINISARRILRDKFKLGLFDNPYVDEAEAGNICGNPEFQAIADSAQRKSIVLLKNKSNILPVKEPAKIYILNMDSNIAGPYATVVDSIDLCDFVIMRLDAPYEEKSGPLEFLMHQGSLEFDEQALKGILAILKHKPAIVCLNLDRPAVIPEIAENAASLLAAFGATDAAILDIIFGKFVPTGKLPFDMPSSMKAVYHQKEDVPFDSENPLFKFGFGLSY
ncbi:glycoside hydrolase family 3 C-terminal domain-containing protein [bacterium]|nr:glycoside hydrolase family 3 C-terminal domain-containing protein [bacterium]